MTPPVITPAYCQMMARYNQWQNTNLLAAAQTLDDAAREMDRGAFFGSIRGTFSHLLWGDTIWMSRVSNWTGPGGGIDGSENFAPDWSSVVALRPKADKRIVAWADKLGDLDGDVTWFHFAVKRDLRRPRRHCVMNMFNHQAHHRGQIHAMLTAAGARPDDTDLFMMPEA